MHICMCLGTILSLSGFGVVLYLLAHDFCFTCQYILCSGSK